MVSHIGDFCMVIICAHMQIYLYYINLICMYMQITVSRNSWLFDVKSNETDIRDSAGKASLQA